MKLYREVDITSAEQAEALPVGTMADDGGLKAMKVHDRWRMIWPPGAKASPRLSVVGWTALVPIEAEEEVRVTPEALVAAAQQTAARANRAAATGMLPPDRLTIQQQTRHVTPWRAQD